MQEKFNQNYNNRTLTTVKRPLRVYIKDANDNGSTDDNIRERCFGLGHYRGACHCPPGGRFDASLFYAAFISLFNVCHTALYVMRLNLDNTNYSEHSCRCRYLCEMENKNQCSFFNFFSVLRSKSFRHLS